MQTNSIGSPAHSEPTALPPLSGPRKMLADAVQKRIDFLAQRARDEGLPVPPSNLTARDVVDELVSRARESTLHLGSLWQADVRYAGSHGTETPVSHIASMLSREDWAHVEAASGARLTHVQLPFAVPDDFKLGMPYAGVLSLPDVRTVTINTVGRQGEIDLTQMPRNVKEVRLQLADGFQVGYRAADDLKVSVLDQEGSTVPMNFERRASGSAPLEDKKHATLAMRDSEAFMVYRKTPESVPKTGKSGSVAPRSEAMPARAVQSDLPVAPPLRGWRKLWERVFPPIRDVSDEYQALKRDPKFQTVVKQQAALARNCHALDAAESFFRSPRRPEDFVKFRAAVRAADVQISDTMKTALDTFNLESRRARPGKLVEKVAHALWKNISHLSKPLG